MMDRLTLWGMYQYYTDENGNKILFKGLDNLLFWLDGEMMNRTLIKECGELYPYYQQPDMLTTLITDWARQRSSDWHRIFDAYQSTYNPIHNYDRTEWSIEKPDNTTVRTPDLTTRSDNTGNVTETRNLNATFTPNTTVTTTPELVDTVTPNTSTVTEGTGENKSSAFDTEDYQPLSSSSTNTTAKLTGDTVTRREGSERQVTSGQDASTDAGTITTGTTGGGSSTTSGTDSTHHTGNNRVDMHAEGNIGVTTTQQMIEAEIRLRGFNIYKYIAMEFCGEFMVRVY